MLTEPQREHVRLATRTTQIISTALTGGVAFFAAIVLVLSTQQPRGDAPAVPILTYAAAGVALLAVVLRTVVPGLIAAQARQAIVNRDASRVPQPAVHNAAELGDVAPLMGMFQTRLIVGAALLEGGAFFCLVAYLLERQPLALIAAGVLFCFLLGQFPSVARVTGWIETELSTVDQLRQLDRS